MASSGDMRVEVTHQKFDNDMRKEIAFSILDRDGDQMQVISITGLLRACLGKDWKEGDVLQLSLRSSAYRYVACCSKCELEEYVKDYAELAVRRDGRILCSYCSTQLTDRQGVLLGTPPTLWDQILNLFKSA